MLGVKILKLPNLMPRIPLSGLDFLTTLIKTLIRNISHVSDTL